MAAHKAQAAETALIALSITMSMIGGAAWVASRLTPNRSRAILILGPLAAVIAITAGATGAETASGPTVTTTSLVWALGSVIIGIPVAGLIAGYHARHRPQQSGAIESDSVADQSRRQLVAFLGQEVWMPLTEIRAVALDIANGAVDADRLNTSAERLERSADLLATTLNEMLELLQITDDGDEPQQNGSSPAGPPPLSSAEPAPSATAPGFRR
ncbi:hypothetical protein BayCH28_25695 [Mycolicibacterium sp. CH28]|uniref:hypothetical protein n=1 Tax=Mycolicibacterium sp. CH28 TaxID=2512237 RepID=UPI00108227E6|nr:hypothetical protein [Mycolicibacterium sp. CH28]TGD84422.1 hypothetical protein BayCH28_25695 [Mycolicibacterium sp. CH28]